VVSPTEIDIFWRDPPAIGYFVIYRNSQKLAPVFGNTTSYHDTDLAPSTKYTYTVQALAADGQASAQSAPQSATTPPSAPTNLVATVQSGGDIALTWTASPDSAVAGYTIYRGTDATVVPTTQVMTVDGRTSTKFTDPNPNPNLSTTYYYAVKATGRAGTSGASNVAYATTPAG
jgi:hypothetical protein